MMGRLSGDVMRKSSLLSGLCASLMLYGAIEGKDQTAPSTRVAVVTDTYHGVSVDDPYRWLENGSDPEVRAWSTAQTARARAYLDALPYRSALAARLMALTSTTSPSYADLQGIAGRLFARFTDPSKQQTMLAVMRPDGSDRPRVPRSERARSERRDGHRLVRAVTRRPARRRLAFTRRQRGRRSARVRGRDRPPDRRGHSSRAVSDGRRERRVDWRTDRASGTRASPAPRSPKRIATSIRRSGSTGSGPTSLPIARSRSGGLPRVAEIQMDYSPVAHALLVTVANGDGGEFAHYVVDHSGAVHQITRFEDDVEWAAFGPDQALYLVSERDAPKRRILKLRAGRCRSCPCPRGRSARRETSLPPSSAARIRWCSSAGRWRSGISSGGPSRLRMFDLDGRARGEAALPPVASVAEMEAVEGDLVYSVETYLTPRTFRRRTPDGRDVATGSESHEPREFRRHGSDARHGAIARRRRDSDQHHPAQRASTLDGSHPTLLYGYGGYGVSETPYFLGATRRAVLRRRRRLCDRQHPRRRRVRRGVARRRVADAEAERLRRLRGGRPVADRPALHQPAATGDPGRLERRTPDGRGADAASRAVSRGRVERRHLRHAARRARSERRVQHHRVRHRDRTRSSSARCTRIRPITACGTASRTRPC